MAPFHFNYSTFESFDLWPLFSLLFLTASHNYIPYASASKNKNLHALLSNKIEQASHHFPTTSKISLFYSCYPQLPIFFFLQLFANPPTTNKTSLILITSTREAYLRCMPCPLVPALCRLLLHYIYELRASCGSRGRSKKGEAGCDGGQEKSKENSEEWQFGDLEGAILSWSVRIQKVGFDHLEEKSDPR